MHYQLETYELQNIIEKKIENNIYKTWNVFPIDLLPENIGNRQTFIVNTAPSYTRGEHWVSIYFPRNSEAEFFDSLGKCPSTYSQKLLDFLIENSPKGFAYNYKRLQPYFSDSCGVFCLYFLFYRKQNESFEKILKEFSENLHENNNKVIGIFNCKLRG